MDRRLAEGSRKRGRPSKFGRPARVVALTLPEDVIDRLHRLHRDIGWAIVKLLDKDSRPAPTRGGDAQPDVELVAAADRQSLIVVNREVIKNLPGVNIVPLSGNRAFLALDIDRGMSDLELAVIDRVGEPTLERRERRALEKLRAQLTAWRRDPNMRFHTRAIIVAERRGAKPSDRRDGMTTRGAVTRRGPAKARAAAGAPGGARAVGAGTPADNYLQQI